MPKQKILAQGAEAVIIKTGEFIIKDRIKKSYRIQELDDKIRKFRTRSEIKLLNKASKIINCPAPLAEENSSAPQKNKLLINKKSEYKADIVGVGERLRGREKNKLSITRAGSRVGQGAGGGGKTKIIMPFIDGKKLSEHLDNFPLKKQKQICKKIGESITKLHDADIIHSDLTTSNMILVENFDNKKNNDNVSSKYYDKRVITLINKNISTSEASGKLRGSGGDCDWKVNNNFKIFFIDFGLGFISQKTEDKAVDLHLLKQALEAKHFENWKILWNVIEEEYKKPKDSKKILERLRAVEKRGRYKDKY